MLNRALAYSGIPATVYCWTSDIPDGRFRTLEEALQRCRDNTDHLSAIEVLVHSGEIVEPIISGDELYAATVNIL